MDRCEIDGALVAHTHSFRADATEARARLAAETAKAHGRLFPLWTALPADGGDFEQPHDFVRKAVDAGVRAVKLYPKSHRYPVVIDVIGPMLEALQSARFLVMLEVGELGASDTEVYAGYHAIASAFPRLPLLGQGFNWGHQRTVTALMERCPNFHVEFSRYQINRAIEVYARRFGVERLLFGTGAPALSAGAARAFVDYADLDETAKRLIAGGNLARLLGGLAPQPCQPPPENTGDALLARARQGLPVLDSPVLDAHCHVLAPGSHGGASVVCYHGDAAGIVQIASRLGTQATAMMSWSGPLGGDMTGGNDVVAQAVRQFPGQVIGVAYLNASHHTSAELEAEMRLRVDEQGFLALKPYMNTGAAYSDPLWEPVWRFGDQRGLYALFHLDSGGIESVKRIAAAHPGLECVVAHSGGSWTMARQVADAMRSLPNIWAEVTLTNVTLGAIEHLAQQGDEDRVLYGTDAPMRDPRPQFGWVVWARLPDTARRKILGGNFARLLNKVRRSRAAFLRDGAPPA